MPKTPFTPRDELICGKIEKLRQMLVDAVYLLDDIQRDADRMEQGLIRRKEQVERLEKETK